MSNSQNTTQSFENASELQSWLTENFAREDVTNAISAFYALSKISSERKAAAYVAHQMTHMPDGFTSADLAQYAKNRTAGK